MLTFNVT